MVFWQGQGKGREYWCFVWSSSMKLKQHEHRSNKSEIPLPMIPFDIVLYALYTDLETAVYAPELTQASLRV